MTVNDFVSNVKKAILLVQNLMARGADSDVRMALGSVTLGLFLMTAAVVTFGHPSSPASSASTSLFERFNQRANNTPQAPRTSPGLALGYAFSFGSTPGSDSSNLQPNTPYTGPDGSHCIFGDNPIIEGVTGKITSCLSMSSLTYYHPINSSGSAGPGSGPGTTAPPNPDQQFGGPYTDSDGFHCMAGDSPIIDGISGKVTACLSSSDHSYYSPTRDAGPSSDPCAINPDSEECYFYTHPSSSGSVVPPPPPTPSPSGLQYPPGWEPTNPGAAESTFCQNHSNPTQICDPRVAQGQPWACPPTSGSSDTSSSPTGFNPSPSITLTAALSICGGNTNLTNQVKDGINNIKDANVRAQAQKDYDDFCNRALDMADKVGRCKNGTFNPCSQHEREQAAADMAWFIGHGFTAMSTPDFTCILGRCGGGGGGGGGGVGGNPNLTCGIGMTGLDCELQGVGGMKVN